MSSKGKDMAQESGGLDYGFVDPPPDDLQCSICLLVLSDPQLTSCCGNHFCRACVKQVEHEGRPCPLCSAPSFSTMLDKYFLRKVNELRVECPQKKGGCPWVGHLGSMERHLDAKTGDCKFMIVECPYLCGTRFHHCELASHQTLCPRRPHVCKFCDYKGVYEDMSAKHWKVCDKYPLPCPNHCEEMDIQRRYLDHHLQAECPLQMIKCEYAYAGCQVQTSRQDMPQHITESLQDHLARVSKKCLDITEKFPGDFQRQLQDKLTLRDQEFQSLSLRLKEQEMEMVGLRGKLVSLQEELDDLKQDAVQLKSTVFVPPFEYIMPNFQACKEGNEQWLGPPFYSHIGGYQMCISVDANGSEDGNNTHVSVYANLMRGEFDNNLRWPFRGSVTVRLLNQRKKENQNKEVAFEEKILFTHDAVWEVSGRVEIGEVAGSGLGIPKFILHSQLGYNAAKNIEYLRHDCLRFCIPKVEVNTW